MGIYSKSGIIISVLVVVILASAISLTGFLDAEDNIDCIIIEVDYFDHWNVTITEDSSTWTWSGFGKMEKNLMRITADEWIIQICAQKMDDSYGYLTMRVKLKDGTVLKEVYTSKPFGKADLTLEIQ